MLKNSHQFNIRIDFSLIAQLSKFGLVLCMLALFCQTTKAATTDWGVIAVDQPSSYSVSGTDITQNFTDQYTFSISGGSSADYSVYVEFDFCKNGCGNPDVSYGIYDLNGGLISDTGSAVLSAGDYVFKVKGTGMGSGNTLDYNGSVNFTASAVPSSFVSEASEPNDILLTITSSACLILLVRLRRKKIWIPGSFVKRPPRLKERFIGFY